MCMKNFVVFIAMSFLFLAGCLRIQLTPEQEEYKSLCVQNSGPGAWMEMGPMKDGSFTAKEACWGCMADMNNMFCDKEKYLTFMSGEQKMSMEGTQ